MVSGESQSAHWGLNSEHLIRKYFPVYEQCFPLHFVNCSPRGEKTVTIAELEATKSSK